MRRSRRYISLIMAIICIIPAIIIPVTWGIKVPEFELVTDDLSTREGGVTGTYFHLMNGYYILFLFTSLLPFIFFTFSATLAVEKLKNGNRKMKQTFELERSSLFDKCDNPKVTIIIPCYNEALTVSSTITSSFRQDYEGDIEIIVVDDGSKDNTWSIGQIFKTASKDRQIKIIHKPNGGKSSALRLGIEKAQGSIILMTDGDSLIDAKAVSSIVDTFRKYPDAGIVGGYVFIKNTHTGYLTRLQQLEYIITQHLIRINQSEDGSVLIAPGPIFGMRTDLARALPPVDRTIVEDCDLTMSVLSTGYTTRATTGGLSYTNAPEIWKDWIKQRKRWIYGQFQAWRMNRWHLKRNPWGLYTYFTWVMTTFSAFIFVLAAVSTLGYTITGSSYYQIIQFLSLRTMVVLLLYGSSRIIVLLQYKEGRRWIHYLPLKIIYDLVNSFLTSYLFIRYLTGFGVKVIWGHRTEVVH